MANLSILAPPEGRKRSWVHYGVMVPDLPRRFRWYAEDDAGNELLSLDCTVKGGYEYGLGAGYTSWYRFDGIVKSEPVSGKGYLVFIDRRSNH